MNRIDAVPSGGRKPPVPKLTSPSNLKYAQNAAARRLIVVAISSVILLASCLIARADIPDPIDSGREALRSPDRFPWYDADKDDIRPIRLSQPKQAQNDNRNDKSAPRPDRSRTDRSRDGGQAGRDDSESKPERDTSFDPSASTFPLLTWIAWIVIAIVLCGLAFALIRAFLDREAQDAKRIDNSGPADDNEDVAEALDELPTRIPMPKSGLLEEARRQYEAGNYNLAVIYLYSYELLKLDQNQFLRLAKGKTNREYLRELADRPELRDIVARCLSPFEDVFFGGHALDRARFEACWNEVERFNRLLGQPA